MALDSDVDICAEAGDADGAIRAATDSNPDICLIGRDLSGDGLVAVRGIRTAVPGATVAVLAHDESPDDFLEAVRAGAVGYVAASSSVEQLRRAVRAMIANEAAVPRAMILDLMLELRLLTATQDITTREAQVLAMLRRGHTTAAIAQLLGIAPVTVRRHISDLVRKSGVTGRSELTAMTARQAS